MKQHYYSCERNVQIVISLLKAHGIKRIIVSPGATNISFVASVQIDSYFEIYSCVDERSAAYMACGLAAESGEPVVLSCTGATSSRNYMPALTEAFYRKLPILAITSSRGENLIGHLKPQVTDRTNVPNDVVMEHVTVPIVNDNRTELLCNIAANKAILALTHRGGGPAHINLLTLTPGDFSIKEIMPVRAIFRHEGFNEDVPNLPNGRIVVFLGAHKRFTNEEVSAVDAFCQRNDAVVLCDHTSGYIGRYRLQPSLCLAQKGYTGVLKHIDLLIHVGGVCGCYYMTAVKPKEVWRVCEDGAIQDFFGTLSHVFEMKEHDFFAHYAHEGIFSNSSQESLLRKCQLEYDNVYKKIPELPLSNIWVANQLHTQLPKCSVIHFGILNSLRAWNFFPVDNSIISDCNVGGFGIDGIVSTIIGASLCQSDKLHFCVLGDLAFFYDMNALGNRHIGKNLRIMVINNGLGQEFKNPSFEANYGFGDDTNVYIGAAGHFGDKNDVMKHYAEDMGFEYLRAETKEEVLSNMPRFSSQEVTDCPILFEIVTESVMETKALDMVCSILPYSSSIVSSIKKVVKQTIPSDKLAAMKTLLS